MLVVPPFWLIVPVPLVTWPPVGPANATPPAPSRTMPLNRTIRHEETSWRFLFRHRFQRNSTLPSRMWKLFIGRPPKLESVCRPLAVHPYFVREVPDPSLGQDHISPQSISDPSV